MDRDFYKVLLLSTSGHGKTMSFRNMNPKTTGFINVENKPLPFKNEFKYHARCMSTVDAKKALKEYAENPEITTIVFDSLSAYLDMLLAFCRKNYTGFEIWGNYNTFIGDFLNYIKSIKKEMFITGHYEWVMDETGARERRCKTKGKEWEGQIEKEFTIVLYADRTFDDGKPQYNFYTALDKSSAKCPPAIFGEDVYIVPNDSAIVLNKILELVNG